MAYSNGWIDEIAAVVLAAGLSTRMGKPKMTLPWGKSTIIGTVVSTLEAARLKQIFVVTGGLSREIEQALSGLSSQFVSNPMYENGEMLYSIQIGLAVLPSRIQAALVVLGDQPQMQIDVVQSVIKVFQNGQANLIIPSFQMRRGHPWLVGRSLWPGILALKPPATMRDFVREHANSIHYLDVSTSTILADVDTPDDYERFRA
jgi:molybdenum cofactor cytidylyltransferase